MDATHKINSVDVENSIDVRYDPAQALKFENKAQSLLQAIDDNRLPACECGYCHD